MYHLRSVFPYEFCLDELSTGAGGVLQSPWTSCPLVRAGCCSLLGRAVHWCGWGAAVSLDELHWCGRGAAVSLDELSTGASGMLQSPTIIVLLPISPFMSVSVCLMC